MRSIDLRCFAAWVDKPLGRVDHRDVERFLASRAPINVRTRYNWLSHLSCFYRWGIRAGHFRLDPTAKIDRPRLPRLLPRPISDDDLVSAIEAADHRLRAMLLLASHMGLRCCEISRLHANDIIDTASVPCVLIHGKGGKDRMVPLHPLVQSTMVALPRRGYLFRRPGGEPLSPTQVSVMLRYHLRDQGIDATGHQLRHWFGTRLYAATLDLRLTQEAMGHANPSTTAGYTAWAQGDLADAVGRIGLASAD